MTLLAGAMRGLMTGGPVAVLAGESMLWALGILVVFAAARRPRLPPQDLTAGCCAWPTRCLGYPRDALARYRGR